MSHPRTTHPILPLVTCLLLALANAPARAVPIGDLFFSEYVEGSSFNKALEIYNGTGDAVDLSVRDYRVEIHFNGSATAGASIDLDGIVDHAAAHVLAHARFDGPSVPVDQASGSVGFNGDDAVVLRRGGAILDVIGRIGEDPGSAWTGGAVATRDMTLRRKPSVPGGDRTGSDVFDPSVEWLGLARDTFDGLGTHSIDAAPVPSPGSSWLLAVGLAGLLVAARPGKSGAGVARRASARRRGRATHAFRAPRRAG
jgi:predicted extracellular nuclease